MTDAIFDHLDSNDHALLKFATHMADGQPLSKISDTKRRQVIFADYGSSTQSLKIYVWFRLPFKGTLMNDPNKKCNNNLSG